MRKPRYCLTASTEGVGKTYPQHQTMVKGYDFESPRSVKKLLPCWLGEGFPDFDPDFNTVLLDNRAIPTDLISSVVIPKCGHLISTRFLELLQKFKLPPHRVYPVPMLHKDEPLEGYWFLLLPHPDSLRAATTTQHFEEGADADPLLNGVSILRLSKPSWLSRTWVDAKLKTAIESEGLTGITLS